MKITDLVHKSFIKFSKRTRQAIDTTKIEFKIKKYIEECNKIYNKMGRLVYDCKRNNAVANMENIDKMCTSIDKYKENIKRLEKLIENIKKGNDETIIDTYIDKSYEYTNLNKKESDLKILRTQDGIKFMKFCPKCNTGNEPYSEQCVKCGRKFE